MSRKKHKKFKSPYTSENELCNALIEYARSNEWKAYPETSNWDILLEKNNKQIGVQAKLKDNINVLYQAVSHRNHNAEPDIIAVLVPNASFEFIIVAKELKIYVIEASNQQWNNYPYGKCKTETIKKINISLDNIPEVFCRNPKHKCWAPEVEINVPAGVKSPREITPWKIKAVKMCIKLNEKGYLTSQDFKDAKLSMTLWVREKWLLNTGEKDGKLAKYVKNTNSILPSESYPEVAEALQKNTTE